MKETIKDGRNLDYRNLINEFLNKRIPPICDGRLRWNSEYQNPLNTEQAFQHATSLFTSGS